MQGRLFLRREGAKKSLIMVAFWMGFVWLPAQNQRCFLFAMRGHEMHPEWDWRDTAFVACTSDPQLIQEVLAEINKPLQDRRMINGAIEYGHGGHNHNGSYWFGWHFRPEEWSLAEFSIELCDGRPYSDVELNRAYWVEQVGRFCPWTSAPLREVSVSGMLRHLSPSLPLFPNPATHRLTLRLPNHLPSVWLTFYNASGIMAFRAYLTRPPWEVDISTLQTGLYTIEIHSEAFTGTSRLVILR